MNEFESIEKELKSISPKSPSKSLIYRIEKGLGDAGNLAIRRLPENQTLSKSLLNFLFNWRPWVGIGLVATLTLTFIAISSLRQNYFIGMDNSPVDSQPNQPLLMDDPESPIHGISLTELEMRSEMPVGGWTPSFHETLVDRIDEGVVSRPSGLPARQVRMHYLDEIIWQHSDTDTRILSKNPRQEIILIDLDLY